MKSKKSQSKQVLSWLDEHLLLVVTGFLLAFIPLFPKIPFFSPIEKYIVRIRIEDFLVLLSVILYFIQVFRKKIKLKSITTYFIGAYAIVGALSVISAFFIIKTVPWQIDHLLKTLLHYFRYLEYFSLFFIAFASIRHKRDLKILLTIWGITLLGIGLYGFGQKYLYWPVYSTMNREFSKGIRLYLTQHARVQSTFAGHYDLAAYLVMSLPLILSLAYTTKNKLSKFGLFGIELIGIWLLVMSAARTSFVGFVLGINIVLLTIALKQEKWIKKVWWLFSRGTTLWGVILMIVIAFGSDISERFIQVIESYPPLAKPYQKAEESSAQLIAYANNHLELEFLTSKQPPDNSLSTDQAESIIANQDNGVLVSSDERPTTEKPDSQRPKDVYEDIPDQIKIATISATGKKEIIVVEQPRVWSDNALQYGLSMAIRLDTLWPQAIRGFLRSPYVGSGYATLNKTDLTDFTIADSTDNNFLRILGETGLLGFVTFFGAILASLGVAIKNLNKKNNQDLLLLSLSIGYLAGTLGLLLNAFFIDVFAASKVAFMFWAFSGIFLSYDRVIKKQ